MAVLAEPLTYSELTTILACIVFAVDSIREQGNTDNPQVAKQLAILKITYRKLEPMAIQMLQDAMDSNN